MKRVRLQSSVWRGVVAIVVFLVLWEIGSKSKLPWIGAIPAPSSVIVVWGDLFRDSGYWQSCYLSVLRVMAGFFAAIIIGIPFGLALAINRTAYGVLFPPFEVLRPIPPLAWVPLSIIFWPTQELSITFVTFLGAFFTMVLNVIGGAKSIDVRYFQAARSMGSSSFDIFRRIILPGVLPSIAVGAAVGMGITWNVVVAAEMISGGASQATGAGGGLGFFIWNSYVGGSYPQIVVGMISIGIAGYLSSELLRRLGDRVTPWLRRR
jgi:NitT/TauT family transport system permease protein